MKIPPVEAELFHTDRHDEAKYSHLAIMRTRLKTAKQLIVHLLIYAECRRIALFLVAEMFLQRPRVRQLHYLQSVAVTFQPGLAVSRPAF